MKTLLVVGDSQSAGYVENGYVKCYAEHLAERNNYRLVNLSRPAVDNRYIKNTLLQYLSKNKADLVLFHIAPYTRKCFYFDDSKKVDLNRCHIYPSFSNPNSTNTGWYRSNGRAGLPMGYCPGDGQYRQQFGSQFDYYFHNYFTEVDSYLETMEAIHSVQTYCILNNIQYFFVVNNQYTFDESFSEAQMYRDDLDLDQFIFYNDREGFDEFVAAHGYRASKHDYHANQQGHEHFSTIIQPLIFTVNK